MAEKEKKVAELEFGVNKALNNLNELETALDNLSKKSETIFSKIGVNLENSFKPSNAKLDTSKLVANNQNLNNQLIKMEVRKNNDLERLQQKYILKKQYEEFRHLNKLEEINTKQVNSSKNMYEKLASHASTYLTYQGFNLLRREAVELVDEMVKVESQMVQIDRVLNDSSLNINTYRDRLVKLAYDYGNSFENVADITLRLAQAGFDAEESIALTEKTLLALNTAELNATQATDDMIAVMAQWGQMSGTTAEQVEFYGDTIDKINIVADKFPTTSADIMDALKKTSSAFNIAGASIDETIALIVAAEETSQRGGKAIGTALSNITQQLKAEKRLDIMESLGIDVYEDAAQTQYKSIIDIITQLSEKMQQLKDDGKETSVEMQQLLEVFTVFRRNVGASLLGNVAGEGSTYNEVLNTLNNSAGYSLAENAKYMATAEAALQQFNATLLELKNTIWDGGGEDMFRSMILLGENLASSLNTLIDTFGVIPTTIGAATLAYSAFNKEIKMQVNYKTGEGFGFNSDFINNIKNAKNEILILNKEMNGINTNGYKVSESIKAYGNTLNGASASTKGYVSWLVKQKAATIAAEAATIALNAAMSIGLSLAITYVIKYFDDLIHAEEKLIQKNNEVIRANDEIITQSKQEVSEITNLINAYEEASEAADGIDLNSKENSEIALQLKNAQNDITQYLIEQGKYSSKIAGDMKEQLKIAKKIRQVELERELTAQKSNLIKTRELAGLEFVNKKDYEILGDESGLNPSYIQTIINSTDSIEQQIQLVKIYREQLEKTGESGKDTWNELIQLEAELEKQQQEIIDSQTAVNNAVVELEKFKILNENDIDSVEEYEEVLNNISNIKPPEDFKGSTEDFIVLLQESIANVFPEYQTQLDNIARTNDTYSSTLEAQLKLLDSYNEKYTLLNTAAKEFNGTGQITSATLQSLINNGLLQYLDFSSGKLRINSQALLNQAEAAKVAAIESLKDAAAKDLEIAATNDLSNLSPIAAGAVAKFGTNASESGKKSVTAAGQISVLAGSMQAVYEASKGNLGDGVDIGTYQKRANAIMKAYTNVAKSISSLNITSSNYSSKIASGSQSATQTFEEQSEERVRIFKEELDDLESLEKSWVNKYKKLELFGTSDLKFITHQRINRYKQYLNEISKLQGISEKDRLELTREYQSKLQEVELEYFDILKDELDDQIDALEEANNKRIDLIKERADAEIEALKKVKEEEDRIKQQQEYEEKRDELIRGNKGIEYWEQRTGREAQEALAEQKKALEELDREWEEKKKEWNIEDQIEAIEQKRDAEIEAIEKAEEVQIESWKKQYQTQVELYAQTGQIMYDGSVINAGYLYKAYMDNFVNPLNAQLANAINSANSAINKANDAINRANQAAAATGSSTVKPVETKPITLKPGQSVTVGGGMVVKEKQGPSQNIVPFSDKLKYGSTISIGKFHGGGKVMAKTEALALLRPNEAVLTPEWAAGLDKLVAKINAGENVVNNNNSNVIEIDGNMINIDAKLNNQQDLNNLTKKIEKILLEKFNIKK